jgi:2-keto-4-pentenoate hydratase/2-oxohepta-3-ene-1,7-dioic acid hydratase in catechol pathway
LKICRVESAQGKIEYGIVIEGEVFCLQSETDSAKLGTRLGKLADLKLHSPVVPGKVIGIGLNYKDHAAEMKQKLPDDPIMFIKPKSSVIGPGEPIILPPMSQRVDYESELGIVIYKPARNVSVESAKEHILGYTCVNDVSARDLQAKDGQWTRAKGFDSFCPIGPWVETEIDPSNLRIEGRLNGKVVQNSNTNNLHFNCFQLVSFISKVMTLDPGDVIATGTPAGIGPMKDGDEFTVWIEGIGELKNPVKAEK